MGARPRRWGDGRQEPRHLRLSLHRTPSGVVGARGDANGRGQQRRRLPALFLRHDALRISARLAPALSYPSTRPYSPYCCWAKHPRWAAVGGSSALGGSTSRGRMDLGRRGARPMGTRSQWSGRNAACHIGRAPATSYISTRPAD